MATTALQGPRPPLHSCAQPGDTAPCPVWAPPPVLALVPLDPSAQQTPPTVQRLRVPLAAMGLALASLHLRVMACAAQATTVRPGLRRLLLPHVRLGRIVVPRVRRLFHSAHCVQLVALARRACDGTCTIGYYCPAGSLFATQLLCLAGTFGSAAGLGAAACSGISPIGHFCSAELRPQRRHRVPTADMEPRKVSQVPVAQAHVPLATTARQAPRQQLLFSAPQENTVLQ